MIAYLIQLLGSFFTVAGRLFDYLNQRNMVNLAKTSQALDNLKAQVDAAHQAVKIREGVRAALDNNPAGVLSDDDGFKRPD